MGNYIGDYNTQVTLETHVQEYPLGKRMVLLHSERVVLISLFKTGVLLILILLQLDYKTVYLKVELL